MTTNKISPYQFDLKSTTPLLDMSNQHSKLFAKVNMTDEIGDMYPFMEVHINDVAGIIVDNIVSAD